MFQGILCAMHNLLPTSPHPWFATTLFFLRELDSITPVNTITIVLACFLSDKDSLAWSVRIIGTTIGSPGNYIFPLVLKSVKQQKSSRDGKQKVCKWLIRRNYERCHSQFYLLLTCSIIIAMKESVPHTDD